MHKKFLLRYMYDTLVIITTLVYNSKREYCTISKLYLLHSFLYVRRCFGQAVFQHFDGVRHGEGAVLTYTTEQRRISVFTRV